MTDKEKLIGFEQAIDGNSIEDLILMSIMEKGLTRYIKENNLGHDSHSFKSRTILRRKIKQLMA